MPNMFKRCDAVPAWRDLLQLKEQAKDFSLNAAFKEDAKRFEHFSSQTPHLFIDFSKCLWNKGIECALYDLADQTGVLRLRDAMFNGECVNSTEVRAAMHWLLRVPRSESHLLPAHLQGTHELVLSTLEEFLSFAESVRSNPQITDVVNIGIGGSDLGPKMAIKALGSCAHPSLRFHFVSNIDAHEINGVLNKLVPENTLFLICSKSFTTPETMTNAKVALDWFRVSARDTHEHFVGMTTNVEAAKQFGISRTFGFWDWVGGRYSVWSSVGLAVAIAVGAENFKEFLSGAYAVDQHFRNSSGLSNIPLRLGLLDVWYRNFLNYSSRNIAPYHSALVALPAYLQQLEMESNGKSVDKEGCVLKYESAPALWGETGTNGQHAYFQMLHQGTSVVPVEFIVVKKPSHTLQAQHELLLANALAQAQALMQGDMNDKSLGRGELEHNTQRMAKYFSGNRPSLFTVLDSLSPASLGAFIAMSEHRTFVAGAVWGINSFDQYGVELGKRLTGGIVHHLIGQTDKDSSLMRQDPSHIKSQSQPGEDAFGLDPSTRGLIARLKAG
jgi:glucose-6-phosphate isomerase